MPSLTYRNLHYITSMFIFWCCFLSFSKTHLCLIYSSRMYTTSIFGSFCPPCGSEVFFDCIISTRAWVKLLRCLLFRMCIMMWRKLNQCGLNRKDPHVSAWKQVPTLGIPQKSQLWWSIGPNLVKNKTKRSVSTDVIVILPLRIN